MLDFVVIKRRKLNNSVCYMAGIFFPTARPQLVTSRSHDIQQ